MFTLQPQVSRTDTTGCLSYWRSIGKEGLRERGKEGGGEQEWRETERTLGITGAWIDLVIQSIRWGLIVCIEVEELALGKTSSLIMTRERESAFSASVVIEPLTLAELVL